MSVAVRARPHLSTHVTPRLVAAVRLVRRSDIAIGYGVVLVGVTVVMLALGDRTYDHVVAESSTNLANLRDRPWAVLVTSAFVVSSPWGLYLLPFLMLGYAVAQRWVGRVGVLVVAAVGHIGATLVVATMLTASVAHGLIGRSTISHVTDVGVSYGLAAVLAFVTGLVPRRWRIPYVVVLAGWFVVGPAVVSGLTFTDVGHTVALLLGGLLAGLVQGAARTLRRSDRALSSSGN